MSNGSTKASLRAAVILVGIAVPAAAQTPRLELSALYQAAYDSSIGERFPLGWNGDVAVNISDAWGAVADVTGVYRSDTDLALDLALHTVGGGARWTFWRSSVSPFAQLIVGVARMSSRASIGESEINASQTRWMLQPGGGLNIAVSGRWGITGQAAYRRIFLDEAQDGDTAFNQVTVSVGVRFGF